MGIPHFVYQAVQERRQTLATRITAPIARFAKMGAASGIVLLLCAVAAMVLANSPLAKGYQDAVHFPIGFAFGKFDITQPAEWWINDALMAVFFFVVGLEIKREILIGELRSPRAAALPVVAAVGGMLVPGLVYAALNWGQPTARGWGIPTATDIAFALGVLALLGDRVPAGLRVFLATLAIADDIGALLVIAVFYTEKLEAGYLGLAGVCLGLMVCFNVAGFRRPWLYLLAGVPLWWFVYKSGVHATIAGVLAAFTIPATSRVDRHSFATYTRWALGVIEEEQDRPLRTSPAQQAAVQGIEDACNKVQTPMQIFEHGLIPWVSFLIVPLFALANAGVAVTGNVGEAFASRETLGIVLGLCVGKPLGITLFAWLALRTRAGSMPTGVSMAMLHACSWVAGIGFTMSLFIGHLAFIGSDENLARAKLGVLAGSTLAAVVGMGLLARAARRAPGGSRRTGSPAG